jgi:drug/metabolite transporter (DMT)-like permease
MIATTASDRVADVRRENVRGIAAMVIGGAALSMMDACLKTLSPHYSTMQVTSMRGFSALPIVLTWIALTTGFAPMRRVRFSIHLVRGILGIGSLGSFAYGLRALPLVEAYSIFFIAPVLITVFAALILRERVEAGRWIAIAAGFGGVLFVLRPTGAGAVSAAGFAILGAALCYSLSAITVRILGRTDSTQSMVFWLMIFIAFGAGAVALPTWRPVRPEDWIVLVALSVAGSIGQWAITEAFKRGESSVIAPFEYTALVWGVSLDWTIWGAMPQARTFVGAAVVIASGVYLLRHERVHVEAEHP